MDRYIGYMVVVDAGKIKSMFKKKGLSMSSVSKELGRSPGYISVSIGAGRMGVVEYEKMMQILGDTSRGIYVNLDRVGYRNALKLVCNMEEVSKKISRSKQYISTNLGEAGSGRMSLADLKRIYDLTNIDGLEFVIPSENNISTEVTEAKEELKEETIKEETKTDRKPDGLTTRQILDNLKFMWEQLGALKGYVESLQNCISRIHAQLKDTTGVYDE